MYLNRRYSKFYLLAIYLNLSKRAHFLPRMLQWPHHHPFFQCILRFYLKWRRSCQSLRAPISPQFLPAHPAPSPPLQSHYLPEALLFLLDLVTLMLAFFLFLTLCQTPSCLKALHWLFLLSQWWLFLSFWCLLKVPLLWEARPDHPSIQMTHSPYYLTYLIISRWGNRAILLLLY